MKVLIFAVGLALFVGANAFPTPKNNVPPQCADPTFACQDLDHARTCGVVKSCIHDIWATMSAPDDNDEVCDICKEMVKEARDQLLSNMTQEELKEVFEGSCKLLPVKLVADACIKLVDEFIPELVEMLASRMDPTMVCTVSGMCFVSGKNSKEAVLHKYFKMILEFKQPNECKQCTAMVTELQTFLKSSSESEDKKYIENICTEKIPSYLCDLIVSEYFETFYSYVISSDAKTICSAAGACPKQKCDINKNQVNDELTCEFCDHVLHHVQDLITTNTTVEEFRTALLNFCKHVGSFSDKCTNLVNEYYDMLFDYIRKMDTKGLCTLMGLCNDDRCALKPVIQIDPPVEPRSRISMVKLQPATRVQNIPMIKLIPAEVASKNQRIESNEISQPSTYDKFSHPIAVIQRDTECAFCQAISFYIQQDLNGDRHKINVRAVLDNVCDKWVKEFPNHCKQFIDKYSVKIQHHIASGFEIDEFCAHSQICLEESTQSELNVRVITSKFKDGPFCDICKDAMGQVEAVLKDPRTKEKIDKLIDQACNMLPESIRNDCNDFLNSQVDTLLSILQQELQPNNICPALKLCDESKRIQISPKVKDLECDVCKDVISNLRQKLTDPNAKEIVLTFLEEGCARLPESLAKECKSFVDENIDTILGVIIEDMDPANICSILKICPSSLKKEKPKKVNNVECDMCKEIVKKVEDMIGDQRTEQDIQDALDKVCSYLPSSWGTKCKHFVDQYTKTLITLLMAEMDPDMICSYMNMCPEKLVKEKPTKVKDLECDLCKDVVTKVEELVGEKKTEAEIQAALDKVCSYLPKSWAAKCKKFVDGYTTLIITLLMEDMNPDMVCAAMNLCSSQGLECEACQYFFHYIQEQLNSPGSQAEVKNLMKELCSVLPETLDKNCEAFVDQYGNSLLVLLAQEIDPAAMCFHTQLCPNETRLFESTTILHPFNTDECSVCTTVVDYLDKLLEEDDVDKEITKLVEKVCTVLPASYVNKCSTLIETYGSYLLQMIGQMSNSKEVCQEIDLCPRTSGHAHLIGGSKCTFGPSYWCESAAHASACKAERFCKEKVWTN